MFMLLSDRQLELRRRVLRTQRGRNEIKPGRGWWWEGRKGAQGETHNRDLEYASFTKPVQSQLK